MKIGSLLFTLLCLILFPIAKPLSAQLPGSGTALTFNGSSTYVNIANSPTLNATTALTLEAWVKPSAFAANVWANVIISKDGWQAGEQGYTLRCGAGGQVSFNIGVQGSWQEAATTGPVIALNTWSHLAATYDGSVMRLYVNGVEEATHNYTGSIAVSNYNLSIGQIAYTAAGNRSFAGEIDEVRMWQAALSQSTIRDWMCQKVTNTHPDYANLGGYYQFDDGTGTLATDLSGNFNHGTLVSSPTWVISGAAIGDASVHAYPAAALGLPSAIGDSLAANTFTGNPEGVQLYVVNQTPNTTSIPPAWAAIDTTHYWGVFPVGGSSPGYQVENFYTSNPFFTPTNEPRSNLLGRTDNSATTWAGQNAARDVVNDILSKTRSAAYEFAPGLWDCPTLNTSANGATSFCMGDTVVLTNATAGFSTWQWQLNGSDLAGETANDISATAPGMYVLIASDSTGCVDTSSTTTVNVWALPAINIDPFFDLCANDSALILSGATPAGGTWSGNGVTNGIFYPDSAGVGSHQISYTYTDSNSCSNSSDRFLAVRPLPPTPIITRTGDTLISSAATGNQWHDVSGAIAGATNNTYVTPGDGDYYVIVTDTNGCVSDTSDVVSIFTGIPGTQPNWKLSAYPSPTSDIVNVQLSGLEAHSCQLNILNTSGQLVHQQRVIRQSGTTTAIPVDLSHFAAGLYLIRITTESRFQTLKVVKE